MRIMCDTNVLISGVLFPDSVSGRVLRIVVEQERLVLATYIAEELRRVFQAKFPENVENLDRYLGRREFEIFVTPHDFGHVAIPPVQDRKDEPVLASAILANVDFLITGDKDFVSVKIDRPVIQTPAAFLKLLRQL